MRKHNSCRQRLWLFIALISFLRHPQFIRGGSAPRSNPLPFYIPFFSEKTPLLYTFYWKKAPLSYTFEFKALFNTWTKIFLPFNYLNFWNPYPEAWKIYLKPEKGTPFRGEPPRIGHYREYPAQDNVLQTRQLFVNQIYNWHKIIKCTAQNMSKNKSYLFWL